MDSAEKQALHNLRQDLQSHMVITDRILRHLLQHNKISKSEKYDLSIHGASSQKIKKLIQILQTRGQPLQIMTDALLLENRNNFIVKKLNKKVRFYRSRQEQEESQSKTHISNQLNPISEILYKKGYRVLYGSCHKHVYPKGHQKLVEGMNSFMKTIEDCRDTFNGCETRHFQDIVKDYCEKKEREIKDAKALCAKLVKVKNCELDEKAKEENCLSEEVEKLRKENEAIRKNMDNEIREKVREGVRRSLLSMPMLSSCLGIKTFDRAREHSESSEFTQNSDEDSLYNGDPHENSEEEESNSETADDNSEAECPATRVTHNYNIFNNYMYSDAKVYQS